MRTHLPPGRFTGDVVRLLLIVVARMVRYVTKSTLGRLESVFNDMQLCRDRDVCNGGRDGFMLD